MDNLTDKEKICNYETLKHIQYVAKLLNHFASDLIMRGILHDQSKLVSPEVELFAEYTPQLSGLTYNSPEYNSIKEKIKPALDHHYANNKHHPEFHRNGIDDMNLVDLVEMFADWYAAGKRHNNGNMNYSLEQNKKRFNISDQLYKIFENTIDFVEDIK